MAAQSYFDWTARLFDPTKIFGRPEALRDLRVLDLGTIFLGPTTTTYLAEYGAEVIKVEIPGVGDTIRALGPTYHWNMSLIGLSEPKNKYFCGLDLRKPNAHVYAKHLGLGREMLADLGARKIV